MEVHEFTHGHEEEAARLFHAAWEETKWDFSLLPEKPGLEKEVAEVLGKRGTRPGFVAMEDGEMIGYMVEDFSHPTFMGKKTAFCGDMSHCGVGKNRDRVYQKLYQHLSAQWVKGGFFAHEITYAAADNALTLTLYRLGFGMTHIDFIRGTEVPSEEGTGKAVRVERPEVLDDIDRAHHAFYSRPPLFWIPWEPKPATEEERWEKDTRTYFAVFEGNQPVSYMIVEKGGGESRIGSDPLNARIVGAYTRESYRGKGLGVSLLAEVARWAKEQGCARIYVDCESANIYGVNFWLKHFTPVTHSVRRCVDERAGLQPQYPLRTRSTPSTPEGHSM